MTPKTRIEQFDVYVPHWVRQQLITCKHSELREERHQMVIDYYCRNCGEWTGDKDVS